MPFLCSLLVVTFMQVIKPPLMPYLPLTCCSFVPPQSCFFQGVILLAPMISLDKVAKAGLNPYLLPLNRVLNTFVPTWCVADTNKCTMFPAIQQDFDDSKWCCCTRYRGLGCSVNYDSSPLYVMVSNHNRVWLATSCVQFILHHPFAREHVISFLYIVVLLVHKTTCRLDKWYSLHFQYTLVWFRMAVLPVVCGV